MDTDLNDLLEDLTGEGYVLEGTPAFDVAKKVIARGKRALTGSEQTVFHDELVPAVRAFAQARERPDFDDDSGHGNQRGAGHG